MKRQRGVLLSRRTTLKIGGPAFYWTEPDDLTDILEAISFSQEKKKPLIIIGAGSNILAQNKGFDGVVVRLGGGFRYIRKVCDGMVEAGAAASISQLVGKSSEWGLGGCEFLAGIPGSIGGAIFMNAGCRDINDNKKMREIKDIVSEIDALDLREKKSETLKSEGIDFRYRSSGLEGKCILGARIRLEKDARGDINNRMKAYMKRRDWIRKLNLPSAGSVFKNPDGTSAGQLIEQCGLKGKRIGGAEISRMHANFIVNRGRAVSEDVLGLIELARARVKEKFGIDLELELKVI